MKTALPRQIRKLKFTLAYVAAIIITSVLFKHYPLLVQVTANSSFSLWALFVGTWFVLRDFSQREIGHYVFFPMAFGVAVGALVNPTLALATAISSSASEVADWLIYTFAKKPFHQRILLSSIIACPVDSFAFFAAFDFFHVIPGISLFNWLSIVCASLSKLLAATFIYFYYRNNSLSLKKA